MIPPWLDAALLRAVDSTFSIVPQRRPTASAAARCRVVSHRGERDGVRVIENTFAAFDPIVGSAVWGLEFDIRWSRDLLPVVLHDATTVRGHGVELSVADCKRDEVLQRVPAVPSLEAFVNRYGDNFHLMIELKPEHYPDPARQSATLRAILGELEPVRDFHLMSLDTALLSSLPDFPRECLIPIARFNTDEIGRFASEFGTGGIGGHYFLMSTGQISRHREQGRRIGIGFPDSMNCLYREINRGADWVFSNSALAIEKQRGELLAE